MTNPFSSYLVIDAEDIVRSNISRNHIKDDLRSLVDAFQCFDLLDGQNINDGFGLSRHVVEKLDRKNGLLDLLEYFGFNRENAGKFAYRSSDTPRERDRRQSGVKEIKRLVKDLKSARDGTFNGFEAFIRNERPIVYSDRDHDSSSDDEPLPPPRSVEDRNAETFALMTSFKESLVTQYGTNPSTSFLRRRLARIALKQRYPDAREFDDDLTDSSIDTRVAMLKQKHMQKSTPLSDEVYMESFIRKNFDENEALDMLLTNPPNLEVPMTPPVPESLAPMPLTNVIGPLKEHCRLMNQQNNNNNQFVRQLSQVDAWDNIRYIVPAIQQIRQKCPGATADDAIFSRICRLLSSELTPKIGQMPSYKIEQFVRVICDSSSESIENLDITAVRNLFSANVTNFDANIRNSLSIQCQICAEYFPRNKMETMFLCKHQFCLTCVMSYYRSNIDNVRDSKSLRILTCCVEAHEIPAESDTTFFAYIEAKLNQWFKNDPDFRQKYQTRIFDATRGAQVKNCGGPKCTSVFFVDENDPIAASRCGSCQFSQCRKCGKKWNQIHTTMTCERYAEWLLRDDPEHPDNLLFQTLGSSLIVCPQCNSMYQHEAGGCEHFTCDRCKTDFCRMCSSLFYGPKKEPKCPINNCTLKNGFHAHCPPNCFREIRDGDTATILVVLENGDIDVAEELADKPISSNQKCPTGGCKHGTSATNGHRLCDTCYKYFLCTLIWTNHLEPWDNNLQQLLAKASVPVPATATRDELIALCQEHLNSSLGVPRERPRL